MGAAQGKRGSSVKRRSFAYTNPEDARELAQRLHLKGFCITAETLEHWIGRALAAEALVRFPTGGVVKGNPDGRRVGE